MSTALTVRRAPLWHVTHARIAAYLLLIALTVVTPHAAFAEGTTGHDSVDAGFSVPWLEPQGINIVDLVGEVPDSFLSGSIISYTPGYGIVKYESGRRSGNTVTVTAKAYPRFVVDRGWSGSMFSCLGQGARIDQMGSVAPASKLRVTHQGKDVTREVSSVSYVPAGKNRPILNPKESEGQNRYRYWETDYQEPLFSPDSQIVLPANMGCELIISMRDYRELTLVFTVEAPQVINADVVATESFTFHSYLGPGYTGLLQSLTDQLHRAGFGDRAERFALKTPAGADYFILNFPASPSDPYTQFRENPLGNIDRAVGGTYRVGIPNGLSVDHVNTMGLPLRGHWQDIDQADGTWLNYANYGLQLSAPEYFLPSGIGYQTCMINGGCPADLLRQIYTTPMTMKVAYLRVERLNGNLERLPVQMAGSGYHGQAPEADISDENSQPDAPRRYRILIPSVGYQPPAVPADDSSGCSWQGGCGWFTADGRMVDYIPRP